jgi:hypothetical protein
VNAKGSREIRTNPIENRCICRDIGQWSTSGINPGKNAGCSREGEIGGNLTHFLQEREEVGAVLEADDVTTDALLARIFPASRG